MPGWVEVLRPANGHPPMESSSRLVPTMRFADYLRPAAARRLFIAGLLLALACGGNDREASTTEIGEKTKEAPHPLGKHLTAQYAGGLGYGCDWI